MEVVILAGGQSKRLRPLTDEIPKCMIPINGKPMLQYHIDHLKKTNIEKIVVACGYKWNKIKEHYGDKLIYSVEDEPRGTAGAIRLAIEHIEGDEFIVVNSDDLNNVPIGELIKSGANTTVISRFRSQFGIVDTEGVLIKNFREKPLLEHWANIGMHLLGRKIKYPETGSLEYDVLPKLAAAGKLKAFKHTGYWVTINTIKELEEAVAFFKSNK
ncbi:MAG TPA: nucleotidyltransferase family protein [archaeon]|nr:nucleotidyltransferase family protein [archaeon]